MKGLPRSRAMVLLLAVVLVGLLFGAWHALRQAPAPPEAVGMVLSEILGEAPVEGFAQALAPMDFAFPRDHGPHPAFRQEWWYYTGNLRAADGRRFGFQLTFFRVALRPQAPARDSAWAANQIYMAHFALTDVSGRRFHHFERFSRAALGLAGAEPQAGTGRFRVWLEDWGAVQQETDLPSGCTGATADFPCFVVRLQAGEEEVGIDLEVRSAKPLVLQGERGLSRKNAIPGNASYYYSFTRLAAQGAVRIGQEIYDVEGHAWMDREWSTSVLSEAQQGWDWFALQLSDGTELMFYQLRRRDGTADPFSAGVFVDGGGRAHPLDYRDVDLQVLSHWDSPRGGVSYPAQWRLAVPAHDLVLDIVPHLPDQELWRTQVRYWEGAVAVRGSAAGRPLSGDGYVELAGYGD